MPYYRLDSSTQTKVDAQKQQASGEMWGRPDRTSPFPTVKAYRGRLPPSALGIEFETAIAPTKGTGTPFEARWYPCLPALNPCSAGVIVRNVSGTDFAVITVRVTKNTQ